MILNKDQENAVNIAIERYKNGERYTCISGAAGTGKTTILMTIVKNLPGIDMYKDVGFVSFTGKAAKVMESKGLPNTSTIHKLIYKFWKDKYGVAHKSKVESIPYKIIVIDEIGMVSFDLLQDLASFGSHIICCGDPNQLPPVSGRDNLLLTKPHAILTEIVRQENGSGIIDLSQKIINGEDIDNYESNDAIVIPKASLTTGMLEWADVVLCGKNNTRIDMNKNIRQLKGFEGELQDNEKIICLNNYWDIEADTGANLTNGTIGLSKNVMKYNTIIPRYIRSRTPVQTQSIPLYNFDMLSDTEDIFNNINADSGIFINGQHTLPDNEEYFLNVNKKYKSYIPMYFDYGYCLTCHKAQGSEWNKVLIIEEDFPFGKKEKKQWLYTAVTRAADKVVVLR